jgi:hypothetical protein
MSFTDINIHGTSIDDNIIENPFQLFFQEIELAIKISSNEIWGSRDSIELSRYLFNQYVTINQIKIEINSFVATYCPHASLYQYDIDVQILKVDNNDLIYIEMKVYLGDGTDKAFLQKFLLGSE